MTTELKIRLYCFKVQRLIKKLHEKKGNPNRFYARIFQNTGHEVGLSYKTLRGCIYENRVH
jgi:predicted Zn-dependent protease